MISRRGFLGLLGGLAAAPIIEPIAKTFFLPPTGGWVPTASGLVVPGNQRLTVEFITAECLRIFWQREIKFTNRANRRLDESFAIRDAKIGNTLNVPIPLRFSEAYV